MRKEPETIAVRGGCGGQIPVTELAPEEAEKAKKEAAEAEKAPVE